MSATERLVGEYQESIRAIKDALGWHEYGSQDERRAKALPALARLERELGEARVREETLRVKIKQLEASSFAALDRIEAVVKAARDVRYDVMNEGFLSQETSDQVHAALEALDSQEERT